MLKTIVRRLIVSIPLKIGNKKGGNFLNPEKAFGVILKKYRGMVSLSQEELAYQCNLDRTYISLLERGLRRPTLNTIIVISKGLNKKPSEIVQEVEQLLNEDHTSEDIG